MDEKPEIYHLPSNYKTAGRWKNISIPNLIEGVIFAFIVDYFIVQVSFTFQFKLLAVILCTSGIVLAFVKGINGERVSLFLLSFFKFLFVLMGKKGKFKMRKVGIKDVESPKSRDSGNRANSNKFEKFHTAFKKRKSNKD